MPKAHAPPGFSRRCWRWLALAVFFALLLFLGPHLGEVGHGLLIGCFVGSFLDRSEP